ncbi:hypothetical protein PghCCS26_08520 [Paenibacillus glycanilyticus]|uniref:Peptidase M10 metallopeptidase domain-containing protein n=1 Tax=Paenibacillus glycanilyticus TaxID=126569 RepID=A0ABQ6NHW2_9BACL|nr:matrixin family metalloprotease [Paenibacillus glycanilyticus]GMK43725.1 hypothetical protein PghCCS26_08520 [Paenibacillus glycanilyticus]
MNIQSLNRKSKVIVSFTVGAVLVFVSTSNVSAANYWGASKYKMLGGIDTGIFANKASTSVVVNGTTFNMAQTALGAMNSWNNLTDAYYPDGAPASFDSEIYAYGANYGNNGLNGWCEMYKDWSDTSPMNPNQEAPSSNYSFAKVFGNAYHMEDGTVMTYDQRKAVYTHEIGHALGLAHASTGVASVMREEAQRNANGWYTPQQDDISGVNNLYP